MKEKSPCLGGGGGVLKCTLCQFIRFIFDNTKWSMGLSWGMVAKGESEGILVSERHWEVKVGLLFLFLLRWFRLLVYATGYCVDQRLKETKKCIILVVVQKEHNIWRERNENLSCFHQKGFSFLFQYRSTKKESFIIL